MTVEDILGLEKYGVFAVAANTVAMFPLPGVRDCIRQKQAVTRTLGVFSIQRLSFMLIYFQGLLRISKRQMQKSGLKLPSLVSFLFQVLSNNARMGKSMRLQSVSQVTLLLWMLKRE